MRMTTLLQKEQNGTPLPLEPIRRSPKHPTIPRSSPQEHPSIPGLSNSQLDHPTGTLANPLQTPRGSGSQISWEQASPHPTPTKRVVSLYTACLLLQERDALAEDLSSHKEPRPTGKALEERPSLLYPLSQRSPFGAPRATCSAVPLGVERPNPHTPQSLRDYLMPAPAEDALVAIRRTLLEETRRTPPEAIHRIPPEAIHRTPPEATRQILLAAILPKGHPVAAHLRGPQVAAHLRDHQVAAHPRAPLAAFPIPGDKALPGRPAHQALQEPQDYSQDSPLLSRFITRSLFRHRPHPGSK